MKLQSIGPILIAVIVGCGGGDNAKGPDTPRRPVEDQYHGVSVTDPYRWLEDGSSPEVRRWADAQNNHTRAILDRVPSRERILQRLQQLSGARVATYSDPAFRAGQLFALKTQPPRQQPFLVVLSSPDHPATERIVVDPNAIDSTGTTSIDFYVPSADGALVAASLSRAGTEDGTLHVYQTATGQALPDSITHVNYPTAGGSAAWAGTGVAAGIYYTRYPREAERKVEDLQFYQQIYFHRLGTPPDNDRYELGRELPRIAAIDLESTDDGRFVLATVGNGFGGDVAHYVSSRPGHWVQLTRYEDGISRAALGKDRAVYFLSRRNAPRGTVLRVPLDATDLSPARTVVPASDASVDGFVIAATRLYVLDHTGGVSHIRSIGLTGAPIASVPVQPVSAVRAMVPLASDDLLFLNQSFLNPPAWYRFHPATNETARTAMFVTSPVDFGDVEVLRDSARSKDGTVVPLTIIQRKGTRRDGTNPTLLTGYGGMGISLIPSFNPARRIWLDAGGVYAIGNLRGGGEYGAEWHEAGKLTRKQNVFDDFEACAQRLIDLKYTTAEHLAIEGASNGGLLMGAVLTQHPESFRAVVSHVGIYDMVRFEQEPNGAFGVPEYGTVTDPAQFKALLAYSPYHRVVDGTKYPAILLTTGENDGRVSPGNSRKFAARLQAANASSHPVLLWTSMRAGHGGAGVGGRLAQEADTFTFLFDQLGIQ